MAKDVTARAETKLVMLSDLHPAPWNPRTISDKRFKQLVAALKADPEFLWDRPILARCDSGEIYAGNMRFRACEYLAKTDKTWSFKDQVPARFDEVTEQLAQERALRDNNQFGEWAEDDLGQLIARLETQGANIMLLGFDDKEIKRLLEAATHPINPDSPPEPETDKIDHLIQKYGTAPGQLWECGEHKIFCGDSTEPENLDILFSRNEKATLLLTDPPYNVCLNYHQDTTQDHVSIEDFDAWTLQWALLWQQYTERQIVTPGTIHSIGFWIATPALHTHHVAPWIKTNSTTEGKVAHWWCWEAMIFCADPKNKTKFGKKRGSDLFEYPITSQNMPEKTTQHKADRLIDYHPCPKPYELWKELITWYSEPNDLIADAFSGSGTTLVAAEQLQRRARVMEISPGYVALALERWAQYTKREPRLVTT